MSRTCTFTIAVAAITVAFAATEIRAASPVPDCDLRIASGPAGKVYELMVRDIQAVCGNQIRICGVPSAGGLENVTILAANAADLGIVQVDILKEMSTDENIGALQAVMPLHANLLHILALAEGSMVGVTTIAGTAVPWSGHKQVMSKFSDLRGMRIAAVGSAQLMAQTLDRQLGYGMTIVAAENDQQGLEAMRAGDVQAVFTLGGWPLPAVANLPNDGRLILVDYDLPPTPPFATVRRNYQNLGAFKVSFLAAPNLLVTRPFKPSGSLGTRVGALQSCLRDRLEDLQEGRYQAGWKEIKDAKDSFGVRPFPEKVMAGAAAK
jgi:TRAP-type uncharacterized transport system substrate-binding protein